MLDITLTDASHAHVYVHALATAVLSTAHFTPLLLCRSCPANPSGHSAMEDVPTSHRTNWESVKIQNCLHALHVTLVQFHVNVNVNVNNLLAISI